MRLLLIVLPALLFAQTKVDYPTQVKRGPVVDVRGYGAIGDGVNDDSPAVLAAIAALDAENGGTIHFPAGTYRIVSKIEFPRSGDYGPRHIERQKYFRLQGDGAAFGTGELSNPPYGGTVFLMEYNGSGGMIETLGDGTLEIDHIAFRTVSATNATPFIYTTNTAVLVHHNSFIGSMALSQTTCIQDAVILGGPTATQGTTVSAPFQGYGTVVESNFFDYVRRAVYIHTFANSTMVVNNTIWHHGGHLNGSAIEIDGGLSIDSGNYIAGNLIEVPGYAYGIKLTAATMNTLVGNSCWDDGASSVACVRFETDAQANTLIAGYHNWGTLPVVSEATAGLNTITTAAPNTTNNFTQGITTSQLGVRSVLSPHLEITSTNNAVAPMLRFTDNTNKQMDLLFGSATGSDGSFAIYDRTANNFRFHISPTGAVRIDDLYGVGERAVCAGADGTLSACAGGGGGGGTVNWNQLNLVETHAFNQAGLYAPIDARMSGVGVTVDPASVRNHINDSTGGFGNHAVIGTLVIPSDSTTIDASAVFAQTVTYSAYSSAVAMSPWCQSRASGAWCFAMNPLVSDYDPLTGTNVASHLRHMELDTNVKNAGTTVEGLLFGGASLTQPASSHAITFGAMGTPGGNTAPWDIAIWGYPGAISENGYGILLDAAGPCPAGGCVNKPSSKVILQARGAGGTPLPMSMQIDASGAGVIRGANSLYLGAGATNVLSMTAAGVTATALFMPTIAASSGTNTVCIDTGGVISSSSTGCGGTATATLSNLGTTAVNASVVPANTGSINLGSASKAWNFAYIRAIASDLNLNLDASVSGTVWIGQSGTPKITVTTTATNFATDNNVYFLGKSSGAAKYLCIGADDHVYANTTCP